MLVNRSVWICLLFLFITCGCGVSHKNFNQFKNSVKKAQADTEKKLNGLEERLETTKTELKKVDGELKGQLDSVKKAQADTEKKLNGLEERLETTKTELKKVDGELKGQLDSVKKAQADTKGKLKGLEERLETIEGQLQSEVKAHDKTKGELADIKVKNNKLIEVTEPFIGDYFDFGKLLIDQAKRENDDTEKKKLLEKAIKRLTIVAESNNKKYSVDAYCYIANTHYYHRSYDKSSAIDAHEAAIKAKKLAEQAGYQKTQDIFDKAQKILDKTKEEYLKEYLNDREEN